MPRIAILALIVGVILAVSLVGQAKEGNVVEAQQPSSGSPQQAVDTRVAEWVESLNNESVSGLVRFYTNNATLSWDGLTGFGTFTGQSNVRLLYTALFANATLLTAIPSPVNTSSLTSTMVSAKFELHLNAQKGAAGLIGFLINVEQRWVNQSGTWEIQKETWTNSNYSFSNVTSYNTYAPTLGPVWAIDSPPIPGYPPGLESGSENESCVTDSDFLYCIGGTFNGATDYYLQLGLLGGTGIWKKTTSYPIPINSESCVTYSAYASAPADILCVGGTTSGVHSTNQTYFAQLSPDGGIGQWVREPSYPVAASGVSCVVDPPTYVGAPGYLYCIGGRSGSTNTTSVYYDKLWPEPGDWNSTTPYPLAGGRSCVIYQRTIYCVSEPTGNSTTDPVYYAQVSGGLVIGGWKQTTSYPIAVTNESCVTFEGYVYCMTGLKVNSCCATGDVYYARLSDGGIQGSWLRATSIPGFGYGSCVVALSSIWCDWGGGIVHNVILGPSTPTVTTTEKVASAIATVTTTATTFSSSGQAVGFASTPVTYALIGTTVLLAVSTLFFATRRKESGG